jgi:ATP-dependent DNA helicase RecG
MKLIEKNCTVDVLYLSATPIPRTMMMSLYGDMETSILNEKPKNRLSIETLVMSENRVDQVMSAIGRALRNNEKVYWICKAIESMDESVGGISNVTDRYKLLCDVFPSAKIGMIHGKMKEVEKEKIMQDFTGEKIKLLVATTVVEVGVDVPDATIIVIENAELFGLSQLHQLRGRVGRSGQKAYCILLYSEKFGYAKKLSVLKNTNDGFEIAEEDLKIRGGGELLGTKQSGVPEFKIADLNFDLDLMRIAKKQAEIIFSSGCLFSELDDKYQYLLKLFGYIPNLIQSTEQKSLPINSGNRRQV